MTNEEYQEFIKKYTPKKPVLVNAVTTFIVGGILGMGSELLLEISQMLFSLPRKESGVLVILTLIVVFFILQTPYIFHFDLPKDFVVIYNWLV